MKKLRQLIRDHWGVMFIFWPVIIYNAVTLIFFADDITTRVICVPILSALVSLRFFILYTDMNLKQQETRNALTQSANKLLSALSANPPPTTPLGNTSDWVVWRAMRDHAEEVVNIVWPPKSKST